MTTITIPKSIDKACLSINNSKKNEGALKRLLKSSMFANAVIDHKKQLPNTSIEEYRFALESLISYYDAGQAFNMSDLVSSVIQEMKGSLKHELTISRNNLQTSFIALLKDVGIIEGNKPLVWCYISTPNYGHQFLTGINNAYRAAFEKTESEVELEKAVRDQKALQKLEKVALENRELQADIKHHFECLEKEDKQSREMAYKLNIPYSKAREEISKKRKPINSGGGNNGLGFAGFVVAILAIGYFSGGNEDNKREINVAGIEVSESNGLNTGETIWRERYIELYKENGGISNPKIEREMMLLSGEWMITANKMKEIVASISAEELK